MLLDWKPGGLPPRDLGLGESPLAGDVIRLETTIPATASRFGSGLHSLEMLLDWKPQNAGTSIPVLFQCLHSLEMLLDWKLHLREESESYCVGSPLAGDVIRLETWGLTQRPSVSYWSPLAGDVIRLETIST